MGIKINPPPLLRETQDRIAAAIARPTTSLIWAGAIVAVMMAIPLAGAVDALVANSQNPTELALDASVAELTRQLSETFNHLAIGLALLFAVVIPLAYGAARMALRAIRGEPSTARDLFAGYLRPFAFSFVTLVLIIAAALPLLVWLIVALIVAVIVGVAVALTSDVDTSAQVATITTTILIIGIPFIFLACYWQVRLAYAALALIDPRAPRMSAMSALAGSWRMTRRQNTELTKLASYATWAVVRSLAHKYGAGLFTRGFPEFVALFSGSYEVLAERSRSHEHP